MKSLEERLIRMSFFFEVERLRAKDAMNDTDSEYDRGVYTCSSSIRFILKHFPEINEEVVSRIIEQVSLDYGKIRLNDMDSVLDFLGLIEEGEKFKNDC